MFKTENENCNAPHVAPQNYYLRMQFISSTVSMDMQIQNFYPLVSECIFLL